ncbi:hypothetical protein AVEN_144871-1 [Araneus ventricosus]|uniref:DDE-1 domain-containing protein n=1 Tax=Araneus ventricosus TaxID=182803 RepID=A0A4Y2EDV3_ARAVE|nr:hypothetical protein AVEN_144871-1 [Araneus ventricosus]
MENDANPQKRAVNCLRHRERRLSLWRRFIVVELLSWVILISAHPSPEELCPENESEISAMFLLPNTTALIQSMDQNVIQNIKLG